jgi:hypothetical protein
MTAWKPIPPQDFICLGMIVTNIDDSPPEDAIRCVPISWCKKAGTPHKIWDDSGAGGGRPGSVWIVSSLNLISVIAGHDPPTEEHYDYIRDS